MTKFELCAECEETFLCRYVYEADEVDAELGRLKAQIKQLDEKNKRLKQEVKKWRKEAEHNYELYKENLEPDELAGFGTHGRW